MAGAVLWRAGKAKEAIEHLKEAAGTRLDTNISACLMWAICAHSLKDAPTAQAMYWHGRAALRAYEAQRAMPDADDRMGWVNRLRATLLFAEAERLIEPILPKNYFPPPTGEGAKIIELAGAEALTAEEEAWLKKLLDETRDPEERRKVEEFFKKSLKDKSERKMYFETEKAPVPEVLPKDLPD